MTQIGIELELEFKLIIYGRKWSFLRFKNLNKISIEKFYKVVQKRKISQRI